MIYDQLSQYAKDEYPLFCSACKYRLKEKITCPPNTFMVDFKIVDECVHDFFCDYCERWVPSKEWSIVPVEPTQDSFWKFDVKHCDSEGLWCKYTFGPGFKVEPPIGKCAALGWFHDMRVSCGKKSQEPKIQSQSGKFVQLSGLYEDLDEDLYNEKDFSVSKFKRNSKVIEKCLTCTLDFSRCKNENSVHIQKYCTLMIPFPEFSKYYNCNFIYQVAKLYKQTPLETWKMMVSFICETFFKINFQTTKKEIAIRLISKLSKKIYNSVYATRLTCKESLMKTYALKHMKELLRNCRCGLDRDTLVIRSIISGVKVPTLYRIKKTPQSQIFGGVLEGIAGWVKGGKLLGTLSDLITKTAEQINTILDNILSTVGIDGKAALIVKTFLLWIGLYIGIRTISAASDMLWTFCCEFVASIFGVDTSQYIQITATVESQGPGGREVMWTLLSMIFFGFAGKQLNWKMNLGQYLSAAKTSGSIISDLAALLPKYFNMATKALFDCEFFFDEGEIPELMKVLVELQTHMEGNSEERVMRERAFAVKTIDLHDRLSKVRKMLLDETIFKHMNNGMVQSLLTKFDSLFIKALTNTDLVHQRNTPAMVYLFGEPYQGKSTAVDYIYFGVHDFLKDKKDFMAAHPEWKEVFDMSMVFPRAMGSPFWEGYCGQPVVSVPEVFSGTDMDQKREIGMEVLRMAETGAYSLNMAFAGKGSTFFTSSMIVATSNFDRFRSIGLEKPEAFVRRLHFPVEVFRRENLKEDLSNLNETWKMRVRKLQGFEEAQKQGISKFLPQDRDFGVVELAKAIGEEIYWRFLNEKNITRGCRVDWKSEFAKLDKGKEKDKPQSQMFTWDMFTPKFMTPELEEIPNTSDIPREYHYLAFGDKFSSCYDEYHARFLYALHTLATENSQICENFMAMMEYISSNKLTMFDDLETFYSFSGSSSSEEVDFTPFYKAQKRNQFMYQPLVGIRFDFSLEDIRAFERQKILDDCYIFRSMFRDEFLSPEGHKIPMNYMFCRFLKLHLKGPDKAFEGLIEACTNWEVVNNISFRFTEGFIRLAGLCPFEVYTPNKKPYHMLFPIWFKVKRDETNFLEIVKRYLATDKGHFIIDVRTKVQTWGNRLAAWLYPNDAYRKQRLPVKVIENTTYVIDIIKMLIERIIDFGKFMFNQLFGVSNYGMGLMALGAIGFAVKYLYNLFMKETPSSFDETTEFKILDKLESQSKDKYKATVRKYDHSIRMVKSHAQSQSDNMLSNFKNVIKNCRACILRDIQGRECETYILFAYGMQFYIPGHAWRSLNVQNFDIYSPIGDTLKTYTVRQGTVTPLSGERDGVIFTFNEHEVPPQEVSDIRSRFPINPILFCDEVMRLMRVKDETGSFVEVYAAGKGCKFSSNRITAEVTPFTETIETVMSGFYIVEAGKGLPGMCAMPWVTMSPKWQNTPILGAHCARDGDDSIVCPLYSTDFTPKIKSQCETMHSKVEYFDFDELTEAPPGTQRYFKPKYPSHMPCKSELRRSVLYDHLPQPCPVAPARLTPFESYYGGLVSPKMLFFEKYSQFPPLPMPEILSDLLLDKTRLFRGFMSEDKEFVVRTIEEVLFGIPGELDSTDGSTSAGYPDVQIGDKPKKSDWFRKPTLEEPLGYIDPDLRRLVEVKISLMKAGIYFSQVVTDCLKDELRPMDRVMKGKTRLFCIGDFADCIIMKMYMGELFAISKRHRSQGCSAVGVNVHSYEWFTMYQTIFKFGRIRVFGGDLSTMDVSTQRWMASILFYFCSWYLNLSEGTQMWNILKALCYMIVTTIHVDGFRAYVYDQGNSSGNFATSFFNTFCCYIYFVTSFYFLKKIHAPNESVEFQTHVGFFAFGDDNLGSCHPDVEWFNNINIAKAMRTLFGVDYTTPSKGVIADPWLKLEEQIFLSRTFVETEKGIVPRLDPDSLYGMLYYVRGNTQAERKIQLQQNLDLFVMEMVYFPRQEALERIEVLKEACRRANVTWTPAELEYWERRRSNDFSENFRLP